MKKLLIAVFALFILGALFRAGVEFYGADICVGDGGVWDETTGECITPEEAEAREAAAAQAKAEKEAKRLAR